jgi:hypothetical protein
MLFDDLFRLFDRRQIDLLIPFNEKIHIGLKLSDCLPVQVNADISAVLNEFFDTHVASGKLYFIIPADDNKDVNNVENYFVHNFIILQIVDK